MEYPVSIQYEITEQCNHKCFYCYNEFSERQQNNPDLERVVDKISQSDIFHITLTGGEPFKDKKGLIYATRRLAQDAKMDVFINTNITLADELNLQLLKEYGAKSMLVSAPSSDEQVYERTTRVKGSFERFLKGLALCNRANLNTHANMVVTQYNFDQIYETARFLIDRFGIRTFCATPLVPNKKIGRDNRLLITADQYKHVLDQLLIIEENLGIPVESLHPPIPCSFENPANYLKFLRRNCCGGRSTLTISSNGEVRPCSHSEEVYGNVLNSPLIDIFRKMEKWRDDSLIPERCLNCSIKNKCRGGCRVCSLVFNGSLKSGHPLMKEPISSPIDFYKPSVEINEKQTISLSKNVRYRIEEDGTYTLYHDQSNFANLKFQGIQILKALSSKKDKTLEQISLELGIALPSFFEFIGKLADKKIVLLQDK